MDTPKLFEISRTGDPFNKTGWDVREYEKSFDDSTCIFRGDLSPIQGRDNAKAALRRMYPGCKVRVDN